MLPPTPQTPPTPTPAPLILASPLPLYTVADARAAGLRLRDGGLHIRVREGVYASRREWSALAPWNRYLARVHAFLLKHPDAILAFESAAALRGIPIFGEPRDIHVYDPERTRSRRFGDVSVHTSRDEHDVQEWGRFLLTSDAQTAVDLMRVLPPAYGLAVGDAVVSTAQVGTVSIADLEALAEGQATRRGQARLELLIPMIDGRSESVGEAVSRAVILWSGFEPPELQVEVRSEGFCDRVDFGWPRQSALGESDGYEKYRAETAEEAVQRVIDEKRREDRLRRRCRAFNRWDWAASNQVTPLVDRIDAMGIPRVEAPQPALLATVGRNPRSLPPARNHSRDKKPR